MTVDWNRPIHSARSHLPATTAHILGQRIVAYACDGKVAVIPVSDTGRTIWCMHIDEQMRPAGYLVVKNVPATIDERIARIEARLGL